MTEISICPKCGEGPLTYITDFDGVEWVECPNCRWNGKPGDGEIHDTNNKRLEEVQQQE